jgi:hypothetical protein
MFPLRMKLASVFLAGALCSRAASAATSGPYRSSADHRYLVDAQGTPFFVHGEAAWSSLVNLGKADATAYLDDCQSRGFNALLVNLIEHHFSSSPPANASGVKPFSGVPFQSTPSTAYIEHARWFVQEAAARDIVVFLNPAYLGINGGDEGWHLELEAATSSSAQSWGSFVGTQLSPYKNVVWHLFGDFDPPSHAKTSLVQTGIALSSTQYSLFAHHFARGASSHDHRETWLTWNYLYPPPVGYMHAETLSGYAATPTIPQILGEAFYERDPQLPTAEDVRRQAWGALTSGAAGHFYGNRHIWAFGNGFEPADWRAALNDPGRQQMAHVKAFFKARSWWLLQPDTTNALVTAGRNAFDSARYVTAALSSDRSWAVLYVPGGSSAVTVNRARLASPFRASWFNPRNGSYTLLASLPNTGSQKFTAPDSNDWVLLLEAQPTSAGPAVVPALTRTARLSLFAGTLLLLFACVRRRSHEIVALRTS